jgi:hypothetical protein
MNRRLSVWLVIVFCVLLLLAGMASGPSAGWAQTVPSTPAVHPLYGDCTEDGEGGGTIPSPTPDSTVPPTPAFEPFLPNSIYVDWCAHALLTIAQPGVAAASVPAASATFDPAVGHRIGVYYNTNALEGVDDSDTGWFIANYSYRVDFTPEEFAARKVALLREICPLGNPCNELLLAKLSKLGAEFSLMNASGEHRIAPNGGGANQLFLPFVRR